MDALGIGRASVVGNSLGGLVALRLALAHPFRVEALVLVDSAGLGREVTPALAPATLPGLGDGAIFWAQAPTRAAQRSLVRAPLLFAFPAPAPVEWFAEQARLGLARGFMETTLSALRSHVSPAGQRDGEILLEELPRLEAPTLVVWGALDKLVPVRHAYDAVSRLRRGSPEIMPACGHLPRAERPGRFAEIVARFLDERPPREASGASG